MPEVRNWDQTYDMGQGLQEGWNVVRKGMMKCLGRI